MCVYCTNIYQFLLKIKKKVIFNYLILYKIVVKIESDTCLCNQI